MYLTEEAEGQRKSLSETSQTMFQGRCVVDYFLDIARSSSTLVDLSSEKLRDRRQGALDARTQDRLETNVRPH